MYFIILSLRLIILLLVIFLGVSFTMSNMQPVQLSLLPVLEGFTLPLYMLSAAIFLSGLLSGIISSIIYYTAKLRQAKKDTKILRKENRSLATELSALKLEQRAIKTVNISQK